MDRRRALAGAAGVWLAGSAAGCGRLQPFGVHGAEGRWSPLAGLTTPRDDFGFAADGKRLYAIGGMTGERGNALDSVEVFDPVAKAWGRAAKLPVALSSLRAAALGARLYTAGGAKEDAEVAQVWTLDTSPAGGRWEPAAPLRTPRMGHGLASIVGASNSTRPVGPDTQANATRASGADAAGKAMATTAGAGTAAPVGAMFAAGGLAGGEPVASLERYDQAHDTWVSLAPLPRPRFNLVLVAAGRRLYAIGGSGADRRPSTAVDVYDVEQDRWSAGPPLPEPLSNFGAALLGSRVHAVLHMLHYVLDLASREPYWQRSVPMPTSRHGLGLLAFGGALYAAGGCSEDPQRDLPVLEAYTPEA